VNIYKQFSGFVTTAALVRIISHYCCQLVCSWGWFF